MKQHGCLVHEIILQIFSSSNKRSVLTDRFDKFKSLCLNVGVLTFIRDSATFGRLANMKNKSLLLLKSVFFCSKLVMKSNQINISNISLLLC